MFFVVSVILLLAVFLLLVGLGFALNFISVMVSSKGLSWGEFFYATLVAAFSLVSGGLLLLVYIPRIIELIA